jgi:ABC-type transport system involved in Fe-S cluster assembly fused permease/ATPase subunit
MDPSQKISILLAEYNTLRAEVLAARSNIAQAIGLTVPVMMGVLGVSFSSTMKHPKSFAVITVVCAASYLLVIYAWNEINTRKFTKRLRGLESKINELAGEPLLTWESTMGWGGVAIPVPKNKPTDTVPPPISN